MWRFFCYWPSLALLGFHLGVATELFRDGALLLGLAGVLMREKGLPLVFVGFVCLGGLWAEWTLPDTWKPLSLTAYVWRDRSARVMLDRPAFAWATRVQQRTDALLTDGMGKRNGVFTRALLMGGSLTSSQDAALARRAGVSHLAAVSGANLVFLLGMIRLPFRGIRRWWLRWLVESALACGLVVVTGGTASMLRAGVMWLFAASAPLVGRRYHPGRSLVLTVWIVSLFQPWSAWFDIGLMLSCAACVGLVFGAEESRDRGWFSQLLITQLAVGAWTMLVSWWIFPEWTWNGLLGTLFLSPLVTVIQGITILALLFPAKIFFVPLTFFVESSWSIMTYVADLGGTLGQPRERFLWVGIVGACVVLRLIHKISASWGLDITNLFVRSPDGASKWATIRAIPWTDIFDREPDLGFFVIASMLRRSARTQQTDHS